MKFFITVGTAAMLLAANVWAQPEIQLKADPARGRTGGRRPLPNGGPRRTTHFLVRFASEPQGDIRAALEERGMRVLQYVPDHAWMVSAPALPNVEGLGAMSVQAMDPASKVSPLLDDRISGALL